MLSIEQNPRIKQQVAARLKTLGVTLLPTEDERTVNAQFPTPIHLDESGKIFKELSRLGRDGYDKKSLHINTVEGVVNVSFTLQ